MDILMVDDDAVARVLLHRILTDQPAYFVTVAENANSALRILENPALHFDVAIIDIVMPDHDAFWLVEELRGLSYRNSMPIALCSASKDADCIIRARKFGIKHYILKPYRAKTLVEKIKHLTADSGSSTPATPPATAAPAAQKLGLDENKHRELLLDLGAKCSQLSAQVSAEYQSGDLEKFAAQFQSFSGSAESLEQPNLARIMKAIGAVLRLEVTARTKLRSALSSRGFSAALETLHQQIVEIRGPDEVETPATNPAPHESAKTGEEAPPNGEAKAAEVAAAG